MKIVNPIARLGEDLACKYLKEHDFKILERNFRESYGEIDIIAIEKDVLCFIEVKTRTSNQFGTPFEAITPWKLKSLIKTAQFYKLAHHKLPEALRIDAIAVLLGSREAKNIELIRNISGF